MTDFGEESNTLIKNKKVGIKYRVGYENKRKLKGTNI